MGDRTWLTCFFGTEIGAGITAAVCVAGARDRASVIPAGYDFYEVEGIGHDGVRPGDLVLVDTSGACLTVAVVAPANDVVVGKQRTRVTSADVYRPQVEQGGDASPGRDRTRTPGVPISELAPVVVAPAIHQISGRQAAGVVVACDHLPEPAPEVHLNRNGGGSEGLVAVAELSVFVRPPAPGCSVFGDGAGMGVARRDGAELQIRGHLGRHETAHLRTVTQAAERPLTPAVGVAVDGDTAQIRPRTWCTGGELEGPSI